MYLQNIIQIKSVPLSNKLLTSGKFCIQMCFKLKEKQQGKIYLPFPLPYWFFPNHSHYVEGDFIWLSFHKSYRQESIII